MIELQAELSALSEMVSASGIQEPLRFTAALANGRDLYAFRYAANDTANTLYFRNTAGNVVVVSEPLNSEHARWKPVPARPHAGRAGRPAGVARAVSFGAQRVAAE